jgi:hypothetical protein
MRPRVALRGSRRASRDDDQLAAWRGAGYLLTLVENLSERPVSARKVAPLSLL